MACHQTILVFAAWAWAGSVSLVAARAVEPASRVRRSMRGFLIAWWHARPNGAGLRSYYGIMTVG